MLRFPGLFFKVKIGLNLVITFRTLAFLLNYLTQNKSIALFSVELVHFLNMGSLVFTLSVSSAGAESHSELIQFEQRLTPR